MTMRQNDVWKDAYLIAWIGACNQLAVKLILQRHAATYGADHQAVRAIRGHLEFLEGNSLGPEMEDLRAVKERHDAEEVSV
jgi:hypothetical protein